MKDENTVEVVDVPIDNDTKITKAVEKLHAHYEENRKKGNILIGSPVSLRVNGEISNEQTHSNNPDALAVSVESNAHAELTIFDFLNKETLSKKIDLDAISSCTITLAPGDVATANIQTYYGDNIFCTLSSIKVIFNNSIASDFTIRRIGNGGM